MPNNSERRGFAIPIAILVILVLTIMIAGGFSLVSAALFHNNFADQIQMVMFLKNLSIAGAFLLLAAHGAGALSVDARKAK